MLITAHADKAIKEVKPHANNRGFFKNQLL